MKPKHHGACTKRCQKTLENTPNRRRQLLLFGLVGAALNDTVFRYVLRHHSRVCLTPVQRYQSSAPAPIFGHPFSVAPLFSGVLDLLLTGDPRVPLAFLLSLTLNGPEVTSPVEVALTGGPFLVTAKQHCKRRIASRSLLAVLKLDIQRLQAANPPAVKINSNLYGAS